MSTPAEQAKALAAAIRRERAEDARRRVTGERVKPSVWQQALAGALLAAAPEPKPKREDGTR